NTSTAQETVTLLGPDVSGGPIITQPPQSQTVHFGTTVTFAVGVDGSGPFSYQWSFDGNPIPGATNGSLVLSNVQFTNAGGYAIVVTDHHGLSCSASATLDLVTELIIRPAPKGVMLYWPAPYLLTTATNVVGPYIDVPGAVSPYFWLILNEQQRF